MLVPGSVLGRAADLRRRAWQPPTPAVRHLPFKIDRDARDRWLGHMRAAVEEARLGALEKAQLLNYFEAAANHMVNITDDLNS